MTYCVEKASLHPCLALVDQNADEIDDNENPGVKLRVLSEVFLAHCHDLIDLIVLEGT